MNVLITSDTVHIREVWKENLEHEFALIRDIVDDYPYIAMDTEYPGVVSAPTGDVKSFSGNKFNFVKANVDFLKLIQIGLTFADENGNLPTCGTGKYCVWQFNFCEFNRDKDVFNQKSIELLINSGIDFKKNNEKGINANCFSELLMSTGIVMNDKVQWVTFHSAYDFGYLLKLLTCKNLPDSQAEFLKLIKIFFPIVYDVKHLIRFCDGFHGGLNKLAKLLGVERIGNSHQAGSDSLLTCCIFFKFKKIYLNDSLEKHADVLFGLD